MKRALFCVALGIIWLAALGTAQALANTYCAELPGDASCDQHFTGTSTSIQAAVDAADNHAGPDLVKVGPGNFVMSSPVYLSNSGESNQLTLTGSGTGQTFLSGTDPAHPDIHFNGGTGSIINDLTISIPDDASNEYKIGLVLDSGATAKGLNVTFAQHLVNGDPSPGKGTTGVMLADGATLKDSTVRLYSSNVNDAVAVFGSGNLLQSTLTAFRDVYQQNATGTVEIRSSALIAIGGGALTEGGTMNIRDSVILNPYGGQGIYVSSDEGPANVLIDGSTILGAPGSIGAVVQAVKEQDDDPGNTNFRVNNSIVYGHDFAIAYSEYFPEDTLTINLDSSAYDSTRVVEQLGAGTPQVTITNPVELNGVDPKFTDPGSGDYSPAPDSPLIDTGQATLPAAGSLAFNGEPRACDGNDDGTIRRDIGAYEFRADPNDDCNYPETSIDPSYGGGAYGSNYVEIPITSSEPDSSFRCSVDGGPESSCSEAGPNGISGLFKSTGLKDGTFVLSARAVDKFGNVDQTPSTVRFTLYNGTGTTGPPIPNGPTGPTGPTGPVTDTTAPIVLGLKYPKKTRSVRVKVRFRANESGVRFTCRLNKGKTRKCRSPWKVPKLKPGWNQIAIRATDAAGNRSKVVKRTIRRVAAGK